MQARWMEYHRRVRLSTNLNESNGLMFEKGFRLHTDFIFRPRYLREQAEYGFEQAIHNQRLFLFILFTISG
jgi:hypothetical protein